MAFYVLQSLKNISCFCEVINNGEHTYTGIVFCLEVEVADIQTAEIEVDIQLPGFFPGSLYHHRRGVNAGDFVSPASQEDRVATCATADIQNTFNGLWRISFADFLYKVAFLFIFFMAVEDIVIFAIRPEHFLP